jgi:hypothetical protein
MIIRFRAPQSREEIALFTLPVDCIGGFIACLAEVAEALRNARSLVGNPPIPEVILACNPA